jgi:hypothetical protein
MEVHEFCILCVPFDCLNSQAQEVRNIHKVCTGQLEWKFQCCMQDASVNRWLKYVGHKWALLDLHPLEMWNMQSVQDDFATPSCVSSKFPCNIWSSYWISLFKLSKWRAGIDDKFSFHKVLLWIFLCNGYIVKLPCGNSGATTLT